VVSATREIPAVPSPEESYLWVYITGIMTTTAYGGTVLTITKDLVDVLVAANAEILLA
jgi:hypothetical protein